MKDNLFRSQKVILSVIFALFCSLSAPLYAQVSSIIIARPNDPQAEGLKSRIEKEISGMNVNIIDFSSEESQKILALLKIEFIPAVVFEGVTSPQEEELLKNKFKAVSTPEGRFIPQKSIEDLEILEFYRRPLIPNHLDVFSMSSCPFSKRAEKRLINYLRAHKLNTNVKVHYIVSIIGNRLTVPHGDEELKETKVRVIIQKYWPNKFFNYLILRQDNSYLDTLRKIGLKHKDIRKKLSEAEILLVDDYQLNKELNINASPTFLWQNKFLISQLDQLVTLSPFDREGNIKEPIKITSGPIKIMIFFSPKCHACRDIKENFLPGIINRYKDKIEISHYDINEVANFNYLLELEEKNGSLERGSIPKVFVGESMLVGSIQVRENLEKIIEGYLHGKIAYRASAKSVSVSKEQPDRLISLFKTFKVGTICWAGLIDGINPCAFTSLIFFLTFLSFSGYRRREVLYIGFFFILSSYLTYFLIGLGLFKFMMKLKGYAIFAEFFYLAVMILVFILGLFSLYDFFVFKKTRKTEDIKLKLPHALRQKIQSLIGKGYRQDTQENSNGEKSHKTIFRLGVLALAIGFLVSILESVCTGQVYFPTIAFITRVPVLRSKAISYLFLYNFMFIIPLLVIFFLTLGGLTSESFSRFSRRHLAKIKFLTALFFLSLFFLLLKLR
ncbi:MAG: hypothetical protein NTZ48_03220 [Candidatus Omnitrophica bacterium]|nr:hypothetical protein [Candidatus Omnitrophota bacterium]